MCDTGRIVILNGAPRSGKSTIVRALQAEAETPWINLGVDVSVLGMLPENFRPGIGLRPGGERPDLEPLVEQLYLALYDSIAAHARRGLNVVAEFGHHEDYANISDLFRRCLRLLDGLNVLLVGVMCPLDEIMRRRSLGVDGARSYVTASDADPVPEPVRRWQEAVHDPGIYDMEVDTAKMDAATCARRILERLGQGNTGGAFARLVDG